MPLRSPAALARAPAGAAQCPAAAPPDAQERLLRCDDPYSIPSLLLAARLLDYAGQKYLYAIGIADVFRRPGPNPSRADLSFWLGRQAGDRNHSRIGDLMDAITELRAQYRDAWNAEYASYRLAAAPAYTSGSWAETLTPAQSADLSSGSTIGGHCWPPAFQPAWTRGKARPPAGLPAPRQLAPRCALKVYPPSQPRQARERRPSRYTQNRMAAGSKFAGFSSVRELAQTSGVRECLHFFTREKQWIQEQHIQLCRVPAPTFLEQKRAEWMAEQFRALGCVTEIDRAGNVVARPDSEPWKDLIALTAHLDTVLAPRNRDEIVAQPDGTLRGPGVADNGAGLAALLAVARALTCSPPLEDATAGLVLVANVGEEGEGNLSGMRYMAQQSPLAGKIRAYLVLDGPSLDHITWQALASRRFEILFTGPGGHSWSDYGNANPVHALSHAISWFTEKHGASANGGGGNGPRFSFNFATIDGGSSINSIPAMARAKVDVRSEDNRRIDELVECLSAVVERALETENQRATGGKLSAKLREIGSRPAGQLPEDAPILTAVRAVDAHLGIRARLDCASTDANVPLSLGLPAVSIGAGGQGGGAHTPAEWFHPEGRDLGLKRILLTLALLLSGERPPPPASGGKASCH